MTDHAGGRGATVRRTFRAMGTDALLVLAPAPDITPHRAQSVLDDACAEIARIESLASRFDPASELSRLNAAGEGEVSTDLRRLITLALAMREATGGRFDPRVHEAMVAAGYDRPIERMPLHGAEAGAPMPATGDVRVHARTGRVALGRGACLDLGGIAKGWTADRVADLLGAHGDCLVSMGGDIAVRGTHDGGPWPIEVAHGTGARTVGLARGGLATSGTDRRRWTRAGRPMHHVIDPSTGAPSATDLLRVTALSTDAATAEAWATALLVSGFSEAAREAGERGITTVLVAADGRTATTGDLAATRPHPVAA